MSKIIQQISKHPIFCGCDGKYLESALEGKLTLRDFSSGECIDLAASDSVCVLLSGAATAYSLDESKSIILRRFGAGEMFGIASLFTGGRELSRVNAKGATRVAFIDKDALRALILSDANVNLNFIKFLSGRVSFLNEKIKYLTAGSPERKLSAYLASFSNAKSFSCAISMSALSEMLDVGRASLYRALAKLEGDSLILRDGKTITVLDRDAMLSKY